MIKIAVIKTGGKQYKVKEKDKLKIEKIKGEKGDPVFFDKVLLAADDKKVEVGAPVLKGKKVEAKIIEQGRDKKVLVVKYKRKTRYKKKYGHRQPFTKVEILKI
ncbi:50S ribosomal protein L21 [Patescibacteria group bacterium]|nr:50S ribosomal protein L21 [Patescibacteria group bacterium]MBU4512646.1 50S ribosomal protein L21 [Patescibacteria group bacterium]MCG2693552.1 50S ribosomal protein L21 [Candidatus Parcubacteria bacterium]